MEFVPGVHKDVPFEEYLKIDAVSASYLKAFARCPASAGVPIERSRSMVIGSAVHALVLEGQEVFDREFAVAPKCDRRTTAGKADWARFEAESCGKTLLSDDENTKVQGCAGSILEHPLAVKFLHESIGNPEVTLCWIDDQTGLNCKARLDRLPTDKGVVFDLKTTTAESRKEFIRAIVNYSYDIQDAWYMRGCRKCGINADQFVFIASCTADPFPVLTGHINQEWRDWATIECDRLLSLVQECKETQWFPSFEIPQHIGSIHQIMPSDLLEEFEMPKYR